MINKNQQCGVPCVWVNPLHAESAVYETLRIAVFCSLVQYVLIILIHEAESRWAAVPTQAVLKQGVELSRNGQDTRKRKNPTECNEKLDEREQTRDKPHYWSIKSSNLELTSGYETTVC